MDKWLPQLLAAGGAKAAAAPYMVIKGEYDPDRPIPGRIWATPTSGDDPAANDMEIPSGYRRGRPIFKKRWW
jgi:hypothetical protein